MNIEQLDTARILISLCDSDMEKYSVSFESLSLTEIHSRRVIIDLLKKASETTGLAISDKRILIEALKYEKGCLLLITLKNKTDSRKRYRIKYFNKTTVFGFSETEDFLNCISVLYKISDIRYPAAAYSYKNRYYLAVRSSGEIDLRYLHIINEYCSSKKTGSVFAAFLAEHALLIEPKNAVYNIGRALTKKRGG